MTMTQKWRNGPPNEITIRHNGMLEERHRICSYRERPNEEVVEYQVLVSKGLELELLLSSLDMEKLKMRNKSTNSANASQGYKHQNLGSKSQL